MTETERRALLAAAEINELTKDFLFALLAPPGNTKIQTIAGCKAGLERAIERIDAVLGELTGEMK